MSTVDDGGISDSTIGLHISRDQNPASFSGGRARDRRGPRYSQTMCPVVWKASSTMDSSWSPAAWWNTEKMFFQPERMLAACELTIWATQRITMSRMVGERFFFMMCSKGRRKSFWKRKLASSPFSRNFIDSCRRESTAKMATSSLELQPTWGGGGRHQRCWATSLLSVVEARSQTNRAGSPLSSVFRAFSKNYRVFRIYYLFWF